MCVSKLTSIGSDNVLSPGRRQAIIWTNAGILLIGPSGANFNEILIEIHVFLFKRMHLNISSRKWRPVCLGVNVLNVWKHLVYKYVAQTRTGDVILVYKLLTHWDRVTHICVSKLIIIGPDNGLSPGRRQATIWTSAGISLIGPLGANFSDILIEIHTFSFKKIPLTFSSGKRRLCCLGLSVLTQLLIDDDLIALYLVSQLTEKKRGRMFASLMCYIEPDYIMDDQVSMCPQLTRLVMHQFVFNWRFLSYNFSGG